MRILGIDPGIAIVGYGVVDKEGNRYKTVAYDAVTTRAHTPLEERLLLVYKGIDEIIKMYKPDAMSIEELFFNNNAKTAVAVGQARGVILLAAVQNSIPIYEYTPLQVKQALTGYGRASKSQIQQMMKSILGLESVPKPDDVADALAIAVCHGNSMRFNSIKNFGGIML
ncbi:MAG: crossover junction endodeoxyribonuclease RuvC [Clostridia bacterium]|nr:crossover junction endodeoxyribonuclease RuvC [Clostridia bacterium]MBQ6937792.1 crossover junction endodeoxyribonuclease RuvC [Clostridia bacterium]MBR2884107.1 crossover junction endodeoxyribonuclease RuvC [Clostridia bacterium]